MVSSLGEGARCWHHYAQTWDQRTGAISIYIDGVRQDRNIFLGANTTFLDKQPALFLGSKCFLGNTAWSSQHRYPQCQGLPVSAAAGFHGEMDDVAFYAGALSAAQVGAIWNRRLGSTGLTPVMGWDFEEESAPSKCSSSGSMTTGP